MDWRQLLRDRIERAKQYPPEARRQGMEGTTEVEFQVAKDGSVKEVMVVRSSGFPILDQASVETIKRAGPLPFVPGTIRLPITYRLREAR
ncbi:MAG: energy transducer TonB [candidate division NC10 bacterium]|nr:energy transducer TonB [candidate division NC10 bacterium]